MLYFCQLLYTSTGSNIWFMSVSARVELLGPQSWAYHQTSPNLDLEHLHLRFAKLSLV